MCVVSVGRCLTNPEAIPDFDLEILGESTVHSTIISAAEGRPLLDRISFCQYVLGLAEFPVQ